MRGEDDCEFNMTKTVLSDPALTQRVLRLANSPMYAVFGGGINTVSKAVIVLGTEAIGHLALGLKLIDGLSAASSQSASARTEMEKALLAGHIARQVASSAHTRDAEEAVVCSMLHSLGRMMVAFYLPESWVLMQQRCKEGRAEDSVVREILGLDLDQIGQAIAQNWGLPVTLVNSLRHVPPSEVGEPLDHADWLAAVSSMSVRCADVLHRDNDNTPDAIGTIANGYADMLDVDCEQLVAAVDTAQSVAIEDAVFVRPAKPSPATSQNEPHVGKPENVIDILSNGVTDMRGAPNSASSTQLLTMALETVYKGLGLNRAIVFLRSESDAKYIAKMGFGEGVQEMLPQLFFDDVYQPDVFHAALANDKMIFVENAQDQSFANKLPRWWKNIFVNSRSFLVLPLTAKRHAVGFIYGDWNANSAPMRIETGEIAPLNELRELVVCAVENCCHLDACLTRKTL